ncbi:transcriptional regulator, TetR family [Arboricoccus pini]|uniref:Transcriptional regulator, TetR family n=1 Tax=Arboricoccus pini TaxID=1963835 RepID=A0A212RUX9_9PROT|nr:TetR/AcrR family transcriptional regulator [Arboricoccus pini]SNB76489.1 transcriptional regulator, TetR family [Arboricoccus pini]
MAGVNLRAKHRQRRVAQVLDAADLLFARNGYEATHIEEIAEIASVAPATVYNYFATKPNLLMELALRHVRTALPARRRMVRNPPDDPFIGINAFERLLAEQALQHLSKGCWRAILAAQYLEPAGKAQRAGGRLNLLIKRQYVTLLRTYQERGRLAPDVDPVVLADLIVGITTWNFSRFIASETLAAEDMLKAGSAHLAVILRGLVRNGKGGSA